MKEQLCCSLYERYSHGSCNESYSLYRSSHGGANEHHIGLATLAVMRVIVCIVGLAMVVVMRYAFSKHSQLASD